MDQPTITITQYKLTNIVPEVPIRDIVNKPSNVNQYLKILSHPNNYQFILQTLKFEIHENIAADNNFNIHER